MPSSQTSESEGPILTLEDKFDAVSVELQTARQSLRDTTVHNEHLRMQVGELQRVLHQLEEDLESTHADINKVQKRIQVVKESEPVPPKPNQRSQLMKTLVGESQGGPVMTCLTTGELKATLGQSHRVLSAAKEETKVLEEALRRLKTHKGRVEADLGKQVAVNTDYRQQVKKRERALVEARTRLRQLERKCQQKSSVLTQIKSTIRSTAQDSQKIDKHMETLQQRVKDREAALKQLQVARIDAKKNILQELELADERDRWAAELREENAELVARIVAASSASNHHADPLADITDVEHMIPAYTAPKEKMTFHQSGRLKKAREDTRAMEHRLLSEFDKVIHAANPISV